MFIERSRQRQKGMASVEMAFVLLFVLYFLILYVQAGKAMQLKNATVIAARSAAWNGALHGECATGLSIHPAMLAGAPGRSSSLKCRKPTRSETSALAAVDEMQKAAERGGGGGVVGSFISGVPVIAEADLKNLTRQVRRDIRDARERPMLHMVATVQQGFGRPRVASDKWINVLGNVNIRETHALHGVDNLDHALFKRSLAYDRHLKGELHKRHGTPKSHLKDLFPGLYPGVN